MSDVLELNQHVETVVTIGPAVDPVSALSVSTMSLADADAAVLVKHGSSVEQNISSFTFSHSSIASGLGFLTLRASVLDTLGHLTVIVEDESLHLPVQAKFKVVSSGYYQWKYGGTAPTSFASAFNNLSADDVSTIAVSAILDNVSTIVVSGLDLRASAIGSQTASQVASYPSGGIWFSTVGTEVWQTATRALTDKTNFQIAVGGFPVGGYANGAITAAAMATGAIAADELASGAVEKIADAILDRDLAGGANGNTRGVRNALRILRNRVDASIGAVYEENDSTIAWSFTTSAVAGDPLVAVDPV